MSVVHIAVPDIGDFKDIPVIDVLVRPGDAIRKEEPLVTLESDKATMDVPATVDGVVEELAVKIGDRVSQGTPLLSVAVAATQAAPVSPPPSSPEAVVEAAPGSNGKAHHTSEAIAPGQTVHASPAIRRFGRELGVELAAVAGTGPNGRITRGDVASFVKRSLHAPAGGASPLHELAIAAQPRVDYARFGRIERVALSRIARISGPVLHRNWITIPHVTNNDEADVTELEAFRRRLNDERPEPKVTMLAFLIKASVTALKAFPHVNASLDGEEIVLKHYYNIGFAADTAGGLLVPVLKHADQKGVLEIAAETAELAALARSGKLLPADMQGGTFSISSLGGIGGTSFTPIVNAPEVAILGVSRAAMQPRWNGTAFEPRLMLPLSLSYDHRVIDGAAAARFLSHLIGLLGDLRRTLL